jgi:hypothetical protein
MAKPSKKAIARTVIGRYPKSFADELRIDLSKNTPHLFVSICLYRFRQARGFPQISP